jgi:hypothetical protein
MPHVENYGAGDNPDILAPCVDIQGDEWGPYVTAGTSYAAPFVASCIANTIQALKEQGINPLPREILAAIRHSSRTISDCVYDAFDHSEFAQAIGSTYSLDLVTASEGSSDLFDTWRIGN